MLEIFLVVASSVMIFVISFIVSSILFDRLISWLYLHNKCKRLFQEMPNLVSVKDRRNKK